MRQPRTPTGIPPLCPHPGVLVERWCWLGGSWTRVCHGTWVLSAFGCVPGVEWRDLEGILGGELHQAFSPGSQMVRYQAPYPAEALRTPRSFRELRCSNQSPLMQFGFWENHFMIMGHLSPVFEENVDEKLNEPRQAQQWPVLVQWDFWEVAWSTLTPVSEQTFWKLVWNLKVLSKLDENQERMLETWQCYQHPHEPLGHPKEFE